MKERCFWGEMIHTSNGLHLNFKFTWQPHVGALNTSSSHSALEEILQKTVYRRNRIMCITQMRWDKSIMQGLSRHAPSQPRHMTKPEANLRKQRRIPRVGFVEEQSSLERGMLKKLSAFRWRNWGNLRENEKNIINVRYSPCFASYSLMKIWGNWVEIHLVPPKATCTAGIWENDLDGWMCS